MKQPLGEFTGVFLYDDRLPLLELDFPSVFPSRTMLRQQAWPVLGGTFHFGASLTLNAEDALAQAESALDTAQTNYEKKKVDIDRAVGDTLERTGVSIDDAKTGVVSQQP